MTTSDCDDDCNDDGDDYIESDNGGDDYGDGDDVGDDYGDSRMMMMMITSVIAMMYG